MPKTSRIRVQMRDRSSHLSKDQCGTAPSRRFSRLHQPRVGAADNCLQVQPTTGFSPGTSPHKGGLPQATGRPAVKGFFPPGSLQTLASGLYQRLSDPHLCQPRAAGPQMFRPPASSRLRAPPPRLPPLTRQVGPEVAFAERAEAAAQRSHVPGGGGSQGQPEQPENRAPGPAAEPRHRHPVEARFRSEAAHRQKPVNYSSRCAPLRGSHAHCLQLPVPLPRVSKTGRVVSQQYPK